MFNPGGTEKPIHDTWIELEPGPFSCGYVGGRGLCPDGKIRTLHPSTDGIPDTFFSVPMFVYVGRARVYGFATPDTGVDGTGGVRFIPYTYRKHHALIEPVEVQS